MSTWTSNASFTLHRIGAFFVTRARTHTQFRRIYSAASDRNQGIICDQTITLTGQHTQNGFPKHLRRIRYGGPESGESLVILTNLFTLPASTICQLYRSRWQVGLFFKWIKQNLRIKAFYGTSENAVKTQIWVAVSGGVLIAIVKKRLQIDASPYTLMQVFSVSLFEKIPSIPGFPHQHDTDQHDPSGNQLNRFGN